MRINDDRVRIAARAVKLQEDTASQECAICLNPLGGGEDGDRNEGGEASTDMAPVLIDCGHVFCIHCIRAHTMNALDSMQNSIDTAEQRGIDRVDDDEFLITCPLCRQDATDVALLPQLLYKNAAEFTRLAHFSQKEGRAQSEVSHYCALARRELAKMTVGGYWNKKNLQQPIIQQLMVELSELEGNYAAAVDQGTALMLSMASDSLDTLENTLTLMSCSLVVVKALLALGQYAEAYTHLTQRTNGHIKDCYAHFGADMNAPQVGSRFAVMQRQYYHDLSRCLYETGAYDRAILAAEIAIESNRHFENVYEYLVKSYQAKGDLPTAIVMMKRAVRYDSPWDKGRQEVLRAKLREMERPQREDDEATG